MVPWTIPRMLTCSRSQQQLREAASHLPALDPYGYGHSVQLLHPRVTEEYRPVDNASSPSHPDDNAALSSLLPVVQKVFFFLRSKELLLHCMLIYTNLKQLLHRVSFFYIRVNSKILYKLRNYSIYLFRL